MSNLKNRYKKNKYALIALFLSASMIINIFTASFLAVYADTSDDSAYTDETVDVDETDTSTSDGSGSDDSDSDAGDISDDGIADDSSDDSTADDENVDDVILAYGWIEDEEGYTYYYLDPSDVVDEDGELLDGVIEDEDGNYYYADILVEIDELYYLFDEDGHLLYGVNEYEGLLYYSETGDSEDDEDLTDAEDSGNTEYTEDSDDTENVDDTEDTVNIGAVQTTEGWISYDDDIYYAQDGGALYSDVMVEIDAYYYIFGEDGVLLYGSNEWNGYYYYSDTSTGQVITSAGWVTDNDGTYYIQSDATLYVSTKVKIDEYYYIFGDDGNLLYGVNKYDGNYYYSDTTSGKVKTIAGWVTYNDNKYYVKSGGKLYVSTKVKIGDYYYYFNSSAKMVTGVFKYSGNYYYAASSGKIKTTAGWVTYNSNKYYVKSGGKLYVSTKVKISGSYYYFNSSAKMVTGVFKYSGSYYYAASSGKIKTSAGWVTYNSSKYYVKSGSGGKLYKGTKVKISGSYYYFNSSAKMVTGVFKYSGSYYYAASSGKIKTSAGWVTYKSNKYYVKSGSGGKLYKSTKVKINGSYYYFNSSAKMVTGVFKYSGNYYYAASSGKIKTSAGWVTYNGSKYYVKTGGGGKLYKSSKVSISGSYYYFNSSAKMVTGVFKYSGNYYYAASSGKIKTSAGWVTYNSNKYYVKSGGKLYKSTKVKISGSYYYFNSSAKMVTGVFKYNGNYYYAASSGKIKTSAGWVTYNSNKYYVKSGGILYKSTKVKISGSYYYFNSSAKMVTGVFKYSGSYYYAASSGKIKTSAGWVTYNSKKYYVSSGGTIYTSQFIHSVTDGETKYYYVNSSGVVQIGTFTAYGTTYTTDSDGVIQGEVSLLSDGVIGIDVSEFNGTIDWDAVKASGVEFVFIRVGGRGYGTGALYEDSKYAQNIEGALEAGLQVGVYFFTQAITTEEAEEEAEYILSRISSYNITLPVVIDTESTNSGKGRHNKISVATRTAVIAAFCEAVEAEGYTAMIYASLNWLNNYLNMEDLEDYAVWVAQWNSSCTYTGDYMCWQYTSSGSVGGISGSVDMDIWYGVPDTLITE